MHKGRSKYVDCLHYRHSLIYAVIVGTHKKKLGKRKPRKSRLLSSTKGEENRKIIINHVKLKIAEIETVKIEECLYW